MRLGYHDASTGWGRWSSVGSVDGVLGVMEGFGGRGNAGLGDDGFVTSRRLSHMLLPRRTSSIHLSEQ